MASLTPSTSLFERSFALIRSPSAVSMLSLALRVGGSLITLPLALRHVPANELGLYYTFLSIVALATLLDFGLGQTVARNCTYAFSGAKKLQASGVPEVGVDKSPNFELLSLLTSACKSYYYVLATLLGLVLAVGGGLFVNQQITLAAMPTHLLGAWLLFVFATSHQFATGFWSNFLFGIGEVGISARIGLVTQIIGLAIMIAGLLGGLGIWAYGLGIGVSGIVARHLAKKHYLKRIVTIPTGGWQEKQDILRTMWPMAWRQGVVLVGAFMIKSFGTLLVTSKLGLTEAASYGLTLQVLAVIFQVCTVPLLIAMPYITRWRVQGDIQRLKKTFFLRTYLGILAAIIMIACLACLGETALTLIGSNTPLLPIPILLLCAIFGVIDLHSLSYNHLVLADNRNPFVFSVLITGIASVIVGILLVGPLGVAGVVLASGLTQCAFHHVYVFYQGKKVLRDST